ncbi:hypothetical protein A6A06_09715 [Streptomyces sp. CB02923]|uniref:hypothetical protein n=1 Tax=Streptomyces sp. CB02923 TaxID=1718985 RepID=UPI00093D9780|nr:hypothetical protein [Streptomyces sp. CB02923]OKI04958.1 hypothetical protein A6A06_09715 [Streptomyces sp. CB02923]
MSARYLITFERIGRHGGRDDSPAPAPITVEATDDTDLAMQVLAHSRRYLASRGVEVTIDLDAGRGCLIVGGGRAAGEFSVQQVADRVRVLDGHGRFISHTADGGAA